MKRSRQPVSMWAEWMIDHRIFCMGVFILFTAFWGYQLRNVRITQSVNVLFPVHHPSMELSRQYQEMLKSPDTLIGILEVKNGDIYSREAIDRLHSLTRAVLNLPGCDASDIKSITETSVKHMEATEWGVETNPVIFPDLPQTPEDFRRLRERIETDPGIRGVYVSYDGTAAAIMAKWKQGDNLKQLYQDLRHLAQTTDNDPFRVHFAGAPALGAHLVHLTGQIKTALLWALGILVIILILYLKSVSGVLFSLSALPLSLVWTAGIAATINLPISFLAIAWVFFLCAASSAYSAFFFHSCRRTCGRIPDRIQALTVEARRSVFPIVAGIIALGLSALTLTATDLPLLSQTGKLGGCWAFATLVIVLVFNPIMLSFIPFRIALVPVAITDNRKSSVSIPHGITAGVLILALIGGACCVSRLTVGANEPGSAFFFPDNPYNRAFSTFNRKFIGGYNLTVVVEGKEKGALNNADTMELISEFQQYLKTETDARACISLAMMMKILNRTYHEGSPKWALIPQDKRELSSLGGAIKMGGTAGKWIDDTSTNGSIQAMYGDDSRPLYRKRLAAARAFIQDHPSDTVEFRLCAGFLGSIAAMDDAGQEAYWISLGGTLLAIFFICLILFRTPGPGILILVTLITAQAIVWIIMNVTGIPISIHVVPAVPLSIGYGAILGISILISKRRPFRKDLAHNLGFERLQAWSLPAMVLIPGVVMIPWAFMDIRFMAETAAVLAVSICLQTAAAAFFLHSLTDIFKQEWVPEQIHGEDER